MNILLETPQMEHPGWDGFEAGSTLEAVLLDAALNSRRVNSSKAVFKR
jgi:hypothetical protein